jgi:hypothetical protein
MTSVRSCIGLFSVSLFLAIIGVLLFGTLHAIVIVPIWRRLLGGFPFALVAAAGMTWFFAALRSSERLRSNWRHTLAFGALLWISVLPTTAVGLISRVSGFHRRFDTLETVAALVVAAGSGALLARLFRLPTRLQITGAALVVVLVLAMAGPIPITNGPRPALLWLGFLPLYVFASVALSLTSRWILPAARSA